MRVRKKASKVTATAVQWTSDDFGHILKGWWIVQYDVGQDNCIFADAEFWDQFEPIRPSLPTVVNDTAWKAILERFTHRLSERFMGKAVYNHADFVSVAEELRNLASAITAKYGIEDPAAKTVEVLPQPVQETTPDRYDPALWHEVPASLILAHTAMWAIRQSDKAEILPNQFDVCIKGLAARLRHCSPKDEANAEFLLDRAKLRALYQFALIPMLRQYWTKLDLDALEQNAVRSIFGELDGERRAQLQYVKVVVPKDKAERDAVVREIEKALREQKGVTGSVPVGGVPLCPRIAATTQPFATDH